MTTLNADQLKKILGETLSPIKETRRAGTLLLVFYRARVFGVCC
jgi:hypothetical protein